MYWEYIHRGAKLIQKFGQENLTLWKAFRVVLELESIGQLQQNAEDGVQITICRVCCYHRA